MTRRTFLFYCQTGEFGDYVWASSREAAAALFFDMHKRAAINIRRER
jgi:hypothetical protein